MVGKERVQVALPSAIRRDNHFRRLVVERLPLVARIQDEVDEEAPVAAAVAVIEGL